MKKPKVLLISGSGRSGTTILSLLLSQGHNVVNVGQMRDLWAGWQNDVTCACGHSLSACPFWGAVKERAFFGLSSDDFMSRKKAMRSFISEAASCETWEDQSTLDELSRLHAWFLEEFRKLLDAVLEVAGPDMLVDSSKSPEIALAFQLVGGYDLYILNMVRDPRAVAFSWKKKGKTNTKRVMQSWLDRQRRLSRWPSAAGIRKKSLRYERFIDCPRQVVANILEWTGHRLPEGLFTDKHSVEVSWSNQHLFPPSNESVLHQKKSKFDISAPSEWRHAHNWRAQMIALWQTFPEGPAYALNTLRQKRLANLGNETSEWL